MSLAYPSRASRLVAFGLAVALALAATAHPARAENYMQKWPAADGSPPSLRSAGSSDTNIGIELLPAGMGKVGIATTSPQSLLHVYNGEVQVGSSGASCAAGNGGAVRFSGSTFALRLPYNARASLV
jgi:hypothetical protein